MATLLALGSALFYGVADFTGGLLSRRADPTLVALAGQVGALALALAAAPLLPAPDVHVRDLAWGALSGVGTGTGMVFLYRGLSRGKMSVVVPLVAVGGTAIPVLVAVVLLGDRPSVLSWSGVVVAGASLWLVSATRHGAGAARTDGVVDALLSSVGIALQYLALAQVSAGAGLWPIVTGRLVASAAVVPLAWSMGAGSRGLSRPAAAYAAAIGGIAALALTLYMLAAQRQLVTIAVVLSSLYPVIPVVLGLAVLRERLSARQGVGLLGAAAAIALIVLG